jgi:hypothetical protein
MKITFEDVLENDDKDEIALYNIKNSATHMNKETLYHSSIGWLLNDKSRNFEKLELLYRENNLNAFVIAKDKDKLDETHFKLSCNDNDNLLYIFDVECVDKIDDYELNYNKLKNVGYIELVDKSKIDLNNNIFKLEGNKIILNFVKMSASESIKSLEIELTKSLGYKPKVEVIGTYEEDVPLLGFKTKDNKYASNICWFGLKNDKNEYEYYMRDINSFIKNI